MKNEIIRISISLILLAGILTIALWPSERERFLNSVDEYLKIDVTVESGMSDPLESEFFIAKDDDKITYCTL